MAQFLYHAFADGRKPLRPTPEPGLVVTVFLCVFLFVLLFQHPSACRNLKVDVEAIVSQSAKLKCLAALLLAASSAPLGMWASYEGFALRALMQQSPP